MAFIRPSRPLLGAVTKFEYPKQVWSPAGGWWANPEHWKTNTAIGFGIIGASIVGLFSLSASKERRPMPPTRKIPSQSWAKFASIDDPRLDQ